LSVYTPADSAEAESIIERILPRLSHINPSVVFAAIKIIVKYLDFIDNLDSIKSFTKKIS
jgi:vesicle coat complex subunit